MKTIFRKISRAFQWLFLCKILGLHEWTAKALRDEPVNLPPTEDPEELKASMKDYMRLYCDICGEESKLNNRYGL